MLGALAAVAAGLALAGSADCRMSSSGSLMGVAGYARAARSIAFCGILRFKRGSTKPYRSLLLAYIAIAVMNQMIAGPMRDPGEPQPPGDAHAAG